MGFVRKSFRVFCFRLRSAFSSPRLVLLLIVAAAYVYGSVSPVADMSADLGIPAHPWAFPHLTNDFVCQLVFMATAVVLMYCKCEVLWQCGGRLLRLTMIRKSFSLCLVAAISRFFT